MNIVLLLLHPFKHFKMELLYTDEDVQRLFSLETSLEMLEKVGYRGNPYKADIESKVQVMQ